MASKLQNPTGAEDVSAETNPQAVVKPKTAPQVVDELLIKTEAYCFKPKKGSVFPAKRRLVKIMVLHSILKFEASGFCSIRKANPISLSHPNIPNANKSNQKQVVSPTLMNSWLSTKVSKSAGLRSRLPAGHL